MVIYIYIYTYIYIYIYIKEIFGKTCNLTLKPRNSIQRNNMKGLFGSCFFETVLNNSFYKHREYNFGVHKFYCSSNKNKQYIMNT